MNWAAVRRFLTAEEVPRWFGLSVVLIYLVGLGTVARWGISAASADGRRLFEQQARSMVRLIGARVEESVDGHPLDTSALSKVRRILREFAVAVPGAHASLVINDTVVASTDPAIEDSPWPGNADATVSTNDVPHIIAQSGTNESLRIQYALNLLASATGGDEVAAGTLDVSVPAEWRTSATLARHAGTLAVVLVVLGALFVVYRCLREQLRGARQIAVRLAENRDRVAERLDLMSIPNPADSATEGWNELIDLTRRLVQSADRNEATAELSKALERTNSGTVARALNAVPDGVLLLNEDGRVGFVNAAACCLLGWRESTARHALPAEVESSTEGRQIVQIIDKARRADGSFEGRSEVVVLEGPESTGETSLRVAVSPLRAGSMPAGAVVMIRDISQQVRAERSREEFVSQVAHELRTPLTNIRAYAETLSSGMFEDKSVITECYNVITKETRRLSRLVEDILSVSQLELGSIEIIREEVNLRRLMEEGVRDVRGMAEEKNIDLQLVLPSKLEPIVGDRDKLAVVVNNLLGNAIKYTPEGGTIVVGCQVEQDEVVMTFKDSGIGIDPADHSRIFQKFERGSGPEVEKETGTGIGLFTAREIARRHGGDIQVMSSSGNGSTFLVRLPGAGGRAGKLCATPGKGGNSRE